MRRVAKDEIIIRYGLMSHEGMEEKGRKRKGRRRKEEEEGKGGGRGGREA